MFDYRTKALAIASVGALSGLASCDDPELGTNLREDGAPQVLAVMVPTVATSPHFEEATFCKLNDAKRPGNVVAFVLVRTTQVCPEDLAMPAELDGVAEGNPSTWFVRIVFDRLLDPNIEEIVPVDPDDPTGVQRGTIANTRPVTLKCGGVDVPYDGFYVPNGSNVSWPLGPSLFIRGSQSVAPTGSDCTVSLNDNVRGRTGEKFDSATPASFSFKIADMAVRAIAPEPTDPDELAATVISPTGRVTVRFTGDIKPKTGDEVGGVAPAEVIITHKPNLNVGMDNEAPDDAFCAAGVVGTTTTAAFAVRPPSALSPGFAITDTMQILDANAGVDDKGTADPADDVAYTFAPGRTYRIEFAAGATAESKAGGNPTPLEAEPVCVSVITP